MKQYSLNLSQQATHLKIKLPDDILKDLTLHALENGYSIQFEIAVRLARSLENDLKMIEEDNAVTAAAFAEVNKRNTPL